MEDVFKADGKPHNSCFLAKTWVLKTSNKVNARRHERVIARTTQNPGSIPVYSTIMRGGLISISIQDNRPCVLRRYSIRSMFEDAQLQQHDVSWSVRSVRILVCPLLSWSSAPAGTLAALAILKSNLFVSTPTSDFLLQSFATRSKDGAKPDRASCGV